MRKARKAHGDKVILDDVTLAFLPGAEIGVVGPNGAGKSTVLRIMAGLDTASNGDVVLAPGATVGMLQQEPPLNEELDVRGNVEEAVKPLRDALTRFEEVSAAMGEPDADFDALLAEQGELMEVIENNDGWELDNRIEQAMDALRCPPGDADVKVLSGGERRRVALCKLLLSQPDLLLLDEPTNLLDALTFDLPRNSIVGVIGPNGAGKTTLFRMLIGEEKPDAGEIKVGETVQISYVEQNRSGIDPKKTLWEVVSDGLDHIKVGNVEMPSRAY